MSNFSIELGFGIRELGSKVEPHGSGSNASGEQGVFLFFRCGAVDPLMNLAVLWDAVAVWALGHDEYKFVDIMQ